ncbi:hypothetical protein BK010_05920 [Tenericutes bacterium MO-XQ]|nr:hypothetical protein BK010_05920 [Tenericutes bacterium MO-XQ]
MCGRFTITLSKEDFIKYLSKYKQLELIIDDVELPNYNVAPTDHVVAMIKHNDTYRVGPLKWGYIPIYAKDPKNIIINARSETLLEKNTFKANVKQKRCVIFADSFYEWKTINGKKVPFRILLKDEKPFAFAGIWSHYQKDGQSIYSTAIITTQANELMQEIHDRMPIILDDDGVNKWLSNPFDEQTHLSCLSGYPSDLMKYYQVSTYVNNASHKDKQCIDKIKST